MRAADVVNVMSQDKSGSLSSRECEFTSTDC